MTKPAVSVIIPVYNTEATLQQCVDSILAQTYQDYEILLVDDGSTDGSGKLCDEYSAKHPCIKTIHQQNAGVSAARNKGIENAEGDWIAFVDADDYLLDNFFEPLESYTANLILTDSQLLHQGKLCQYWTDVLTANYFHSISEVGCFVSAHMDVLRSPWGKFYRKDIIGNLRFDQTLRIGEDAHFVFNYLCRITSLSVAPESVYVIRECEVPDTVKWKMDVDYAAFSLHKIYLAFRSLDAVYMIGSQGLIFYFNYFKKLSKLDWEMIPSKWFQDKRVREVYNYIKPELPILQRLKYSVMALRSKW